MPLEATDLIQPKGEIEPDLFAADDGGDTRTRVTSWLEQAVTATGGLDDDSAAERAQRAYVYWRAFSSKARRMQADAAKKSDDVSTSEYSVQQMRFFSDEGAKYKAEYDAIIADVADESVAPKPTSRAVSNQIIW